VLSFVVCGACRASRWTRVPPDVVERVSSCSSCGQPALEIVTTEPDAFDSPYEPRFDRDAR